MLTIKQIAGQLGVATPIIHRWVNDGTVAGERVPWRIRLDGECVRASQKGAPRIPHPCQAMRRLGVSRIAWRRVKRGEIEAIERA